MAERVCRHGLNLQGLTKWILILPQGLCLGLDLCSEAVTYFQSHWPAGEAGSEKHFHFLPSQSWVGSISFKFCWKTKQVPLQLIFLFPHSPGWLKTPRPFWAPPWLDTRVPRGRRSSLSAVAGGAPPVLLRKPPSSSCQQRLLHCPSSLSSCRVQSQRPYFSVMLGQNHAWIFRGCKTNGPTVQ